MPLLPNRHPTGDPGVSLAPVRAEAGGGLIISYARLLSEKYFLVRRMVFQGTKIRRARFTRHSRCVRRTLRRETTFLSADWY
jgi:hypothetical protein